MEDPLFTWGCFALVAVAYFSRKAYLRGRREGLESGYRRGLAEAPPARRLVPDPPKVEPVAVDPSVEARAKARDEAVRELVAMGFPEDVVRAEAARVSDPDPLVVRERVARALFA